MLLPGVDRAGFAVGLAAALRRAGVPVGLTDMEALTRALALAPPATLSQLYWLARVTLVRRRADHEAFDAVFAAVFGAKLSLSPPERSATAGGTAEDALVPVPSGRADEVPGDGLPWATLPRVSGTEEADATSTAVPERLPSRLEAVADVAFEDLDPADLELVGAWLETALAAWPRRRSRRPEAHARGQRIALRPTLAAARQTGFEPVRLVRQRPADRPRRVVMLCDVSQSMQAEARAYLHLMRALARAGGAPHAEVFAFATSLTRLTRVLDHTSPTVAVDEASAKVTDAFGGTRIASCLAALLSSPHGGAVRGAVVVIASDGWDSDPPEDLARVMARLARRAHRVLWLNPRTAVEGYEPLVASVAAALPFCDEVLPAHTMRALGDVLTAVGRVSSGRGSAGRPAGG